MTRVTFFTAKQVLRRATWRPASNDHVSWFGLLSLQSSKHLGHGFLQFRRKQVSRTVNGEDLITAVGFVSSPWAIGNQVQLGQPRSGIPKRVAVEARHSPFDPIESPTGKPVTVRSQGEKQVKRDILWLQSFKKALASNSMVDPSKGFRYFANPLWQEDGQRLLERHGIASVVGKLRRHGRSATPVAFSSKHYSVFQIQDKKSSCAKQDDYKSPRKGNKSPKRERTNLVKNNLGRKFNRKKQKTTDMRTWPGK
jgi:hypothetical protein